MLDDKEYRDAVISMIVVVMLYVVAGSLDYYWTVAP